MGGLSEGGGWLMLMHYIVSIVQSFLGQWLVECISFANKIECYGIKNKTYKLYSTLRNNMDI